MSDSNFSESFPTVPQENISVAENTAVSEEEIQKKLDLIKDHFNYLKSCPEDEQVVRDGRDVYTCVDILKTLVSNKLNKEESNLSQDLLDFQIKQICQWMSSECQQPELINEITDSFITITSLNQIDSLVRKINRLQNKLPGQSTDSTFSFILEKLDDKNIIFRPPPQNIEDLMEILGKAEDTQDVITDIIDLLRQEQEKIRIRLQALDAINNQIEELTSQNINIEQITDNLYCSYSDILKDIICQKIKSDDPLQVICDDLNKQEENEKKITPENLNIIHLQTWLDLPFNQAKTIHEVSESFLKTTAIIQVMDLEQGIESDNQYIEKPVDVLAYISRTMANRGYPLPLDITTMEQFYDFLNDPCVDTALAEMTIKILHKKSVEITREKLRHHPEHTETGRFVLKFEAQRTIKDIKVTLKTLLFCYQNAEDVSIDPEQSLLNTSIHPLFKELSINELPSNLEEFMKQCKELRFDELSFVYTELNTFLDNIIDDCHQKDLPTYYKIIDFKEQSLKTKVIPKGYSSQTSQIELPNIPKELAETDTGQIYTPPSEQDLLPAEDSDSKLSTPSFLQEIKDVVEDDRAETEKSKDGKIHIETAEAEQEKLTKLKITSRSEIDDQKTQEELEKYHQLFKKRQAEQIKVKDQDIENKDQLENEQLEIPVCDCEGDPLKTNRIPLPDEEIVDKKSTSKTEAQLEKIKEQQELIEKYNQSLTKYQSANEKFLSGKFYFDENKELQPLSATEFVTKKIFEFLLKGINNKKAYTYYRKTLGKEYGHMRTQFSQKKTLIIPLPKFEAIENTPTGKTICQEYFNPVIDHDNQTVFLHPVDNDFTQPQEVLTKEAKGKTVKEIHSQVEEMKEAHQPINPDQLKDRLDQMMPETKEKPIIKDFAKKLHDGKIKFDAIGNPRELTKREIKEKKRLCWLLKGIVDDELIEHFSQRIVAEYGPPRTQLGTIEENDTSNIKRIITPKLKRADMGIILKTSIGKDIITKAFSKEEHEENDFFLLTPINNN